MESRAFGSTETRTSLYVLRMKPMDYLFLAAAMLILGSVVYIRFFANSLTLPAGL